jgi:hypothetical protein
MPQLEQLDLVKKYGLGLMNVGGAGDSFSQMIALPTMMDPTYRKSPNKVWNQLLAIFQIHSAPLGRTTRGWSNGIVIDVEQGVRLIHTLYDLLPTHVQRGLKKESGATEEKYCPHLVQPYCWGSDYD